MSTDKLTSETRSCWDVYAEDRKEMDALAERYIDFLSTCKTERETVDYMVEKALEAGFSLDDDSSDKVVKIMRGKSMFLARRGKKPLSEGVRLLGAHCDAPRLDFKQHPVYEECNIGLAKTHYYGGIRKYQWFARPLALHGVIVKQDGEVVKINIGEDASDPVFTVLDLLPHLAYEQVEKKLAKAFDAEKMNIVLGHAPAEKDGDDDKELIKKQILVLLNKKYGIVEEDFYSAEIQVVPAGPARTVGLDGSLIGSYGQDDRICVFTGYEALMGEEQPEHTQIVLFWDKEEIGSDGSTGAKSMFFEYCMQDLLDAWEPKTPLRKVLLNTKAVSADVHGGLDPDYQEVHEKRNAALVGHGPVFCKFTGHRGKYSANDAHAEFVGWIRKVMNDSNIPWQMAELGKVDLGGGGTVAKYLAVYGMDIIDFGPAILAMHSPFEIASKADVYATMRAYQAFLRS